VPRTVDFENEVVVITGGASGLGLLIAQNYGMRGASVAVLDVRDFGEEGIEEVFGAGVLYIRCDVGDRAEVEDAKGRIVDEVCFIYLFFLVFLFSCFGVIRWDYRL
jgi:NAD(P)-dependent dehydrogenase (short-subunit alcohol dehydrogenase family)